MIDNFDLEKIINTLPGHIYWKDKDGVYRGCNDEQARSVGLIKAHELIGKSDFDIVSPEEAQMLRTNDLKIMNGGKPIVLEETVTLPSGKTTFISHKMPLLDEAGQVVGLLGMSINIMSRKEYEKLLYQARIDAEQKQSITESYLKSILANLPGHVFWEDKNGLILGCNDAQAQSVGFEKAEDIIGKTLYEMAEILGWDEKTTNHLREKDLEVVETGRVITYEEEVHWKDGKTRTHLAKKTRLKDLNDQCIGILGLSFDITERKKIEKDLVQAKEEAEAANRAKTVFIANISHDLRTPLHALISTAELLKIKKHLPEQEEYVDGILQSGKTLLRLIENVIDFAKFEEGNIAPHFESFNLRELLIDILASIKQQADKNSIQIILNFPEKIPEIFTGEPNHLARILINLLGNALKFTKQGHIEVSVEALEIRPSDVVYNISVADTGIGIPATELTKIFERFHRVDPSYAKKYSGAGLGLSITKKLIDTLNGKIQVESELGVGTKFTCTIPLQIANDVQNLSVQNQEISLGNYKIPPNILLVEDTPLIQKITAELLTEFGCRVTVASTGAEALQFVAKKNYDLIFLDIGLPDFDGYTVIQKIRTELPEVKTPIVGLTAHTSEEIKQACLNAGANDYLSKPISYKDLLSCIDKHLQEAVLD